MARKAVATSGIQHHGARAPIHMPASQTDHGLLVTDYFCLTGAVRRTSETAAGPAAIPQCGTSPLRGPASRIACNARPIRSIRLIRSYGLFWLPASITITTAIAIPVPNPIPLIDKWQMATDK